MITSFVCPFCALIISCGVETEMRASKMAHGSMVDSNLRLCRKSLITPSRSRSAIRWASTCSNVLEIPHSWFAARLSSHFVPSWSSTSQIWWSRPILTTVPSSDVSLLFHQFMNLQLLSLPQLNILELVSHCHKI